MSSGRSYGYTNSSYGLSSSSPYSFGSSYISGPSYHGSSGYTSSSASRILSGFGSSSSTFSSSFDLPRPKTYGIKPSLHYPSPCRVVKPSFMPSISESHIFNTRPTPPPPSIYRPLLPSTSSYSPIVSSTGRNRMNVRNTANIDVINRPPSRKEPEVKEASRPPVGSHAIQRDFTVGTLRRGRKVIRLQTTRLPSPESIPKSNKTPPKVAPVISEDQREPNTRAAARPYGRAERTILPVNSDAAVAPPTGGGRVKKTPGEKMKEKYMVASRKGPKKATVIGLHQRLLAPTTGVVTAPIPPTSSAVTASIPPTGNKDSGLGSSPIVTAPTSFRDPKLSDVNQESRNGSR